MSLFLQRVDAVPLKGNEDKLTFELQRWLSTLTDSLNTTIEQLEALTIDFNDVTEVTQLVELNTGYIAQNALLTTFTLPAVAATGSRVVIAGQGAAGWLLKPAVGQTIKVVAASAAVSIASTSRYDSIEIVCIVADTTWSTLSTQTAGFVIT